MCRIQVAINLNKCLIDTSIISERSLGAFIVLRPARGQVNELCSKDLSSWPRAQPLVPLR